MNHIKDKITGTRFNVWDDADIKHHFGKSSLRLNMVTPPGEPLDWVGNPSSPWPLAPSHSTDLALLSAPAPKRHKQSPTGIETTDQKKWSTRATQRLPPFYLIQKENRFELIVTYPIQEDFMNMLLQESIIKLQVPV